MLRDKAKKIFKSKIFPIIISLPFQIFLYLLFLTWYLCHPLYSFSTFELKPRGTFFDENALLPYGSSPSLTRKILHSAEAFHLDFLKNVVQPNKQLDDIYTSGDKKKKKKKNSFHRNGCGLASYQTYLNLHNNDKIRPGLKSPCSDVIEWVNKTMSDVLGIDNTYIHHFQEKDRRPLSPGDSPSFNRKNIYGILYPKRAADRKEIIVLTASYSTLYRYLDDTTSTTTTTTTTPSSSYNNIAHNDLIEKSPSGVAIGLAMIKELKKVTWLSKRIILVIHDGGSDRNGWDYGMNVGAKRWADMYMVGDEPPITLWEEWFYGIPDEYQWKTPNEMRKDIVERTFKRAGSIFATLGLDFNGGEKLQSSLGMNLIGYNGLTPNMDYVNIISKTHSGNIDFSNNGNHLQNYEIDQWIMKHLYSMFPSVYFKRMSILCQFMFDLAFGPSQGAHSHFLGYAIPSMTLGPAKGYETGGKYNKYNNNQPTTIMEGNTYHHHNHASYNNEKMIISLERIIRCLSNLSEDFHNAFWNYIMMSTETFVAYGEYAWCVVIGATSIFLVGFGSVERGMGNDGIKSKLFRTPYPYKIVVYSLGKGAFCFLYLVILWYVGREIYGLTPYNCCKYWVYGTILFEIMYVSYSWKLQNQCHRGDDDNIQFPTRYEWEGLKAILCGYSYLCHPIIGIMNYGMVFLSIAYLGPHILSITKGYNVYRRITYVTFTPITWFVLLWFYNGWMLEFVIELFEMKTMHILYICAVLIPMQNMARAIVESSLV